jgi:hypothetical protein
VALLVGFDISHCLLRMYLDQMGVVSVVRKLTYITFCWEN